MAALIGALRVSLSADTAKFEQGMKRAQRQAHASGGAITKSMAGLRAGVAGFVGALSVGLLSGVIKSSLEYGGSLGEVAQQLGVTTKDLQVFRFAAGQSGVSSEEMDKALSKLTITMGKASLGAKEPAKAFAAIGISLDDLKGKDTGQVFRMISDGLAGVTDRSKRAALEVAFFGKTGAKLDTVLAGGSAAINELAKAAEELGIVLSDDQIRNADKTADKLEAMQTVLKANIAGAVANNAEAILSLAEAFMKVVVWAGKAAAAMATFLNWANKQKLASPTTAEWGAKNPNLATGIVKGLGAVNPLLGAAASKLLPNPKGTGSKSSVTVKLAPATITPPAMPTLDVPNFLGGGSPGGSKNKPKGTDNSARDANQLDQQIRRANMDILRAKQSLAIDYVEQASLAIQILDAERAAYAAELAYEVKAGEKTQAVASQLLALYDQEDAIKRQVVQADEAAQAAEDNARLDQVTADLNRDKLESELQLATTAKEERRLRLLILDHLYAQERARLQAVIDDQKSSAAAKEEAHRRMKGLGETYANDKADVVQGTRGPWEEYMAGIPKTADEMEAAFEQVRVNGVEALTNSLTEAVMGAKSLGDAFKEVAKQIIADLARIFIQKAIVGALGNVLGAFGGSSSGVLEGAPAQNHWLYGDTPGFARGGSFSIMGRRGVDRNIMSLNGLPIARVSRGERVNIGRDGVNSGGGSAKVTIIPTPYFDAHVQGQAAQVAAPMASSAAVSGAAGAHQRLGQIQRRRYP